MIDLKLSTVCRIFMSGKAPKSVALRQKLWRQSPNLTTCETPSLEVRTKSYSLWRFSHYTLQFSICKNIPSDLPISNVKQIYSTNDTLNIARRNSEHSLGEVTRIPKRGQQGVGDQGDIESATCDGEGEETVEDRMIGPRMQADEKHFSFLSSDQFPDMRRLQGIS